MIGTASINIVHALNRALHVHPIKLSSLPSGSVRALRNRSVAPSKYYVAPIEHETLRTKSKRIKRELLDAGMTLYGLLKSETRILPKLLHPDEHVEAVIYGQHQSNSAMLVATNERILYIDRKPIALFLDEVTYEVVSGIQFDIHLFFASIVLHTPVKNYNFKFVNLHCGENFARHIEKQRLERESKKDEPIVELIPGSPEIQKDSEHHELNDMAGYYWLPNDEEEHQKI